MAESDILTLLKEQKSFALFRMPNGTEVYLCMQNDGGFSRLESVLELPRANMFVFAPFAVSAKCPVIAVSTDVYERVSLSTSNAYGNLTFKSSSKGDYAKAFEKFHRRLNAKGQQKLVLSRKMSAQINTGFSPLNLFCKAAESYKDSFVYLFYTPATGFWCGSTMEVLLSGAKGRYITMSVAGTQQKKESGDVVWDVKNRNEQALVSDFIRDVLRKENCRFSESAPYTTQAGNLLHLRTDFTFEKDENVLRLLASLYPTPAVCGIPQRDSQQFIVANEGYNREYYAGFLGTISPEGCDLFVNLRCVKIEGDEISFYAGGGILPQSTMESEWDETEAKMETMKQLFRSTQ
ncbi:MAG: chorismate-binding protein [Paludibacteraceae bacterium]|nr:chorismate-binding protein [Paludibacteraceae bacterium]